jgi:uncharacterized protein YdhG (YjbR/CyaY superfamily)
MKKSNEIDKYIAGFPPEIQERMEQVRETIRKAAPIAEEVISYKMPAYKLNGVLVYFAGYKNHIGFYPTSSGIRNFEEELTDYQWSKGAIQFPHDKKLPHKLIEKIVKFRVKEDSEKTKAKKK